MNQRLLYLLVHQREKFPMRWEGEELLKIIKKMQVKLNEKEKKIAHKIIGLIKQKIPMNKESPTGVNNGRDSDDSGSSTSGSR